MCQMQQDVLKDIHFALIKGLGTMLKNDDSPSQMIKSDDSSARYIVLFKSDEDVLLDTLFRSDKLAVWHNSIKAKAGLLC